MVLDGELEPVKKPPDDIEDTNINDYNMVMMLAGDNGPHREMAVDVPDTFIARNKTPPRYPPPKPIKLQQQQQQQVFSRLLFFIIFFFRRVITFQIRVFQFLYYLSLRWVSLIVFWASHTMMPQIKNVQLTCRTLYLKEKTLLLLRHRLNTPIR